MKATCLGKVAEINPPLSKAVSDEMQCSFVPMEFVDEYRGAIVRDAQRRVGEVKKGYTPFQDGDVIFAKITPCMENGKCAIASHLTNGVGFGSTEFHVLRPGEDITPGWIYFFLRQKQVRNLATRWFRGTAGQQRVPAEFLEAVQVVLPSVPEQHRITGILQKADRLRRLRRYAAEVADDVARSIFLEMFYTNAHRSWRTSTIAAVARPGGNSIRTGPFGSQLLHSEFVDKGIAVLGIDNAVQNRFVWARLRYITEEKYQQLHRYKVHPGDVIITIMATTGRCAVIPDNIPNAINSKHLCCITLDREQCLPQYLQYCFLNHPAVLRQLGTSERGAIMPGLNMEIIKNLVIPVPPIEMQRLFVSAVKRLDRLYAQDREALRQAEHLFQTLLHRAFCGEL